jgi:hypothetical protein
MEKAVRISGQPFLRSGFIAGLKKTNFSIGFN